MEYDFVYVDEESFEKYKPTSFRQLLEAFKEYKEKYKALHRMAIPLRSIAAGELYATLFPSVSASF